ncbi:uncharacterized protein E0L32_008469 [Thyridium curvatum]|uniref:DNA-directed RNA polymerase III subunit RPC3 n=1 Tax=Thyridium curvatum TaxID=1093900 RepID=A0A507AS00_9PEZI|nr:uncharacterized protein E0L32_008469 [Thyridium curvatum]TPX10583.1 hypothetical protein E0L32_008469 [Thyridium curvatum]
MLVTKNLAELCALLIDDLHGELPSFFSPQRIFGTLLSRGRSAVVQLVQQTSLTPKQIRHGLIVLLQHNLVYYRVDDSTKVATFEANPDVAYNLVRSGKILAMIEEKYGPAARDVIQNFMVLGHTKIGDLVGAYRERIAAAEQAGAQATTNPFEDDAKPNGEVNGGINGDINGDVKPPAQTLQVSALDVKSTAHLNEVLCELIQAEILTVVNPKSFQSPADRNAMVSEQIMKLHFPDGVKAGKKKIEFDAMLSDQLGKLRDEPTRLKRKLDESRGGRVKSRKITNGDVTNGFHHVASDVNLELNAVLRLNYEKCTVEMRNQTLVQAASESIGHVTGQVYAVLLQLLGDQISRCQLDTLIDNQDGGDNPFTNKRFVTTADILDSLSTSLDVSLGIGKAPKGEIDVPTAERVHRDIPREKLLYVEEPGADEGSGDENMDDDDEFDYDSEGEVAPANHANGANGHTNGKVRFEDAPPAKESRLQQMRQHLLLLCDSKQGFVRHCGHGRWTVDYDILLRNIRTEELDNVIERKVGRQGLRLARILREKGKLDEKALPALALMKKTDVQNKMLEMQMHGYVDVQEVPRDNNRTASRTIFLWFCDPERSSAQLLDNSYKAMLRCMQIRDVHRRENKDVLTFVERPDVKGREQEALEKKYFDKYERFRDIENKLLGQVMRLDDLVAVLRDY